VILSTAQNDGNGKCPSSHPVRIVSIFFEYIFDVGSWPFYPGVTNWVLATGDTTGLGFHGYFRIFEGE